MASPFAKSFRTTLSHEPEDGPLAADTTGMPNVDYVLDPSLVELAHPLVFVFLTPGEPVDGHFRRLLMLRDMLQVNFLQLIDDDSLRVNVRILHDIPQGQLRIRIDTSAVVTSRPVHHRRRRSHWGSGVWLLLLDATISLPPWVSPIGCETKWAWANFTAEFQRKAPLEWPSPFRVLQVGCSVALPFSGQRHRRKHVIVAGDRLNPELPRVPWFETWARLPWPWLCVAYAIGAVVQCLVQRLVHIFTVGVQLMWALQMFAMPPVEVGGIGPVGGVEEVE